MRDFYEEHKESIIIAVSIIAMIAGIVLMILSHFLVGVLVLLGGILFCGLGFSKILRSGGYNAEATTSRGLGGMGRSGNEVGQDKSLARTSETDASIWDTMTGKKP